MDSSEDFTFPIPLPPVFVNRLSHDRFEYIVDKQQSALDQARRRRFLSKLPASHVWQLRRRAAEYHFRTVRKNNRSLERPVFEIVVPCAVQHRRPNEAEEYRKQVQEMYYRQCEWNIRNYGQCCSTNNCTFCPRILSRPFGLCADCPAIVPVNLQASRCNVCERAFRM
jgi:hypothetical protein